MENCEIPGNVLLTSNSSSTTLNCLNKFIYPYFYASPSFGFFFFTSFSESKQKNLLLLKKWQPVLLLNKYDVGLTDVEYKISLSDPTPIK